MPKPLGRLKALILDLLFPVECLGCGRENSWLCRDCLRKLRFGDGQKKIGNLKIPALDKIFIAGDYNDALLADMIKKFKYQSIAALGKPLADFLSLYWSGQIILYDLNDPLIIPIPLSKKRLRWRGFNQTEILAKELAERFSYSLSSGLRRIKHNRAQATLNEADRSQNMLGVFSYTGNDLSGRTIIIIDDVATTGATLNEAALVLRSQGATKVYGLVLAKG